MSEDTEQKAQKLESLEQQLKKVRDLSADDHAPVPGTKGSGDAAKAAVDFGSSVAVGTLIGYGFDRWLDTLPWGLLVGLLIGTAAGVKLMLQVEKNRQERNEKKE